MARFYENAQQNDSGWEYDEYHLELRSTGNLAADIEGNFDVYFNEAKRQEEEKFPPSLEQLRADMDYVMVISDLM